jgi:hypothetical protein
MGRRSRKARPPAGAQPPAGATPRGGSPPRGGPASGGGDDALRRGYARSRARDDALRAQLQPLGPGERPAPLVAATVVAALLGLSNLAFLAAGVEVSGEDAQAGGVVALSAVLLLAAWGMWRRRYWAVLGFQVLLGITIAFAAISLLVASNLAAVVLCVAIAGLAGWLFWKLVRVMGRMQAPSR